MNQIEHIEELKEESRPELEVLVKKVYGNERFYPVSNDAKMVCELMKTTTLTRDQLRFCKDGGWRVTVKSEEYSL
jgi:hypothetical protein